MTQNGMKQNGEASVEEILKWIKKVIARDNRADAMTMRERRAAAGVTRTDTASETVPEPVNASEAEEILDLSHAELVPEDDAPEADAADDALLSPKRREKCAIIWPRWQCSPNRARARKSCAPAKPHWKGWRAKCSAPCWPNGWMPICRIWSNRHRCRPKSPKSRANGPEDPGQRRRRQCVKNPANPQARWPRRRPRSAKPAGRLSSGISSCAPFPKSRNAVRRQKAKPRGIS